MLDAIRRLFASPRPATAPNWKKQGNEFLAQGKLPDAIRCYRQAVEDTADDPAARLNLGFALLEQKDYGGARRWLQESLRLQADNHEAHFLLARLERASGDLEAALKAHARTLSLQPDFALAAQERNELLAHLGQECIKGGREAAARDWFQQWTALSPEDPNAHAHLGLAWECLQDMDQAEQSYRAALVLAPGHAQALFGLGNVFMHRQQPQAASDHFARVLVHMPDHTQALANLAKALVASERYEQAEARFTQILKLRPSDADALLGRANCMLAQGHAAEALSAFEQVLLLKPQSAHAHLNRGNALQDLDRLEPALESFREALRARPGYAEALVNIGNVLQRLTRYRESCDAYEQALLHAPDNAAAHWNLGLARLVMGDFEAGWAEAEWRWRALGREPLPSPQPQWTGKQPLQGKTILVYSEQGLGDTIQFCRYVALLAARGAQVVLRVQSPLQRLLRTLQTPCELLTEADPTPAHDYHCALLSLPLAFGASLQTNPQAAPYLASQPQLVARCRELVGSGNLLRVGLVWSGNPAHVNDRNRSLPLTDILKIAMPGVRLVSLQKEVREADRPVLDAAGISHPGELLSDFEQTAAFVECMDLVVTVDTSVAHLAGALGKPVWILLPFSPDWRWLLQREDSPWYPSARLFRQPALGDWQSVLASVRHALAGMTAQATRASDRDSRGPRGLFGDD